MNKRLKTLILALLIALVALSVVACNDETATTSSTILPSIKSRPLIRASYSKISETAW